MSRASVKYEDIPDGLLSAYREYQRLWRKGLPAAAGAKAYRSAGDGANLRPAGASCTATCRRNCGRREYGKMRRKGRAIPKMESGKLAAFLTLLAAAFWLAGMITVQHWAIPCVLLLGWHST